MRLLIAFCLLAASASASPVFNIKLTKRKGTGDYLKGFVNADRARAASLRCHTPGEPVTVPATNLGYVQYTTKVGIGNPPTYYDLVVDTGSSNTFCGTGAPYVRTSTSIPTGDAMNITYGIGFAQGLEYLDQVTLAPDLVITNQSIGDALSYASFTGVDGIIGVGPVGLTLDTLTSHPNTSVPTVMNNLVSQGFIEHQVLGISFAPATNNNDTNGFLTYGGVDPSLYEGELTYIPVTETSPSNQYFGINVTCTYGNSTAIIANSTAGIVDTGTTLVLLADDLFDLYIKAIPGAGLDPQTNLTEIPHRSVPLMKPLTFWIDGKPYTLDVAAQLFPIDENVVIGGIPGKQYGVVSGLGSLGGAGLDFILGQKFMERYYAVFDTDANAVGFAPTVHTNSTC